MKANITLKLDADLLREIRVLAAEEGTSISALLAAASSKWCATARPMTGHESAPWLGCARGSICSGRLPVPATSFTSDDTMNHAR